MGARLNDTLLLVIINKFGAHILLCKQDLGGHAKIKNSV